MLICSLNTKKRKCNVSLIFLRRREGKSFNAIFTRIKIAFGLAQLPWFSTAPVSEHFLQKLKKLVRNFFYGVQFS